MAALPPDTVSEFRAAACAKAGVKRIRLHDARHTCGTLMHLEHNVPVAIISPWLGHADTAFTIRTYVQNQPEKLALDRKRFSNRFFRSYMGISAGLGDGKKLS